MEEYGHGPAPPLAIRDCGCPPRPACSGGHGGKMGLLDQPRVSHVRVHPRSPAREQAQLLSIALDSSQANLNIIGEYEGNP